MANAVIVGAVGAVVFAQKVAKAADLGDDCCADLEDRVAELEATTSQQLNQFNDDNSNDANIAVFRRDFDELAGLAAIKHKPPGLFAMGVFSISESDDSNVFGGFNGQDAPTMRAWNVQAGIQRRLDFLSLNKLGETSLGGAAIPT